MSFEPVFYIDGAGVVSSGILRQGLRGEQPHGSYRTKSIDLAYWTAWDAGLGYAENVFAAPFYAG